jgi:AcrR family transcriptional regulator
MESATKTSTRISREEWLDRALDWLEHSKGYFRLDDLVKALGVTTGSFYWHFKGRDDFINSLLEYWEVMTTRSVIGEMEKHADANAKTQLLELMRILRNKAFCRHDIAVRNLAIWHQGAAKKVAEVDEMRLGFVRKLFEDVGFSGDDLEARAHAFAVFHSLHEGFYAKELTDSETEMKAMFEMFTRK